MSHRYYFVYVLASHTRTLYVGVTRDLRRRCLEHQRGLTRGFTSRYNVRKLVYFEIGESAAGAIAREKQIKGWRREKKVALVESVNPEWKDLIEAL